MQVGLRGLVVRAAVGSLLAAVAAPVPTLAEIDPAVRDRAVAAAVAIAIVAGVTDTNGTEPIYLPVGSGTVVSPNGLILTNQHVVDMDAHQADLDQWEDRASTEGAPLSFELDEDELLILVSDGGSPPEPTSWATVVAQDEDLDFAVLRVRAEASGRVLDSEPLDLSFIPLGDSDALQLGDAIDVFGYPTIGGDSLTYTTGVVSGFNFVEGIEGRAWITTDATISGGSSGGTAIDRRGLLVGVPTAGASLDCRPGDTNADGSVDAEDVGCVPTGGSIGQLRPINLAKPLLRQADPTFSSSPATVTATLTPVAAVPEQSVVLPIPTIPPVPTPTIAPLPTASPLPDEAPFGFVEEFDQPWPGSDVDTDTVSSFNGGGYFAMEIKAPGGIQGYVFDAVPTEGRDIGVAADVFVRSGQGEVNLILRSVTDDAEWTFAVDPVAQTWALYRSSFDTGQFFYWVEPVAYANQTGASRLQTEVRVRDGVPTLLINGVDVVAPLGIAMPPIAGSLVVGFGAGINPYSVSGVGSTFAVTFDRLTLYELP